MFKNVASQKLIVYVFDSTTNLPKTGDAANLTAYVSKDWGTVTVLGDTSATEMDSTNAKGFYLFDLTQGETNGDCLLFTCKSSTANMVVLAMPATVFTTPPSFPTFTTPPTAAANATAVWQDTTSGDFTVASSIGKSLYTAGVVPGASGGLFIAGSNATLVVSGVTTFTGAVTATNASNSIVGIDVAKVNAVSTSSVTTIGANLGTTQPVNFTGTGASALAKVDVIDSAGQAVTNFDGTASAGGATSITLDAATAVATANIYNNRKITLISGTGAGQVNVITTYAANRVATVLRTWTTNPSSDTTYILGETVDANVALWRDAAPSVLISGRVDANTQATASSLTFGLTGNITGNLSGSVASVVGAVGSVTGNVGGNVTGNVTGSVGSVVGAVGSVAGNVTGSVGSVASGGITTASFAAGAIDNAAIAANAIGASELANDAVLEIAAGVWDLPISGHTTSGTTGGALNAAGAAGDPWSTVLPGAYAATTAGFIIGTNINALITSRMATYVQPTGFLSATFPSGTIANTTNITAGTITTVSGNVNGSVGSVSGSVTGSVGSVVSAVTVGTNNDKTGYSMVATGLDLVLVAGKTLPNAIKYIGATTAGKLPSGAGSGQEDWLDFAGNAAVDITVDSSGNRTVIVYH